MTMKTSALKERRGRDDYENDNVERENDGDDYGKDDVERE